MKLYFVMVGAVALNLALFVPWRTVRSEDRYAAGLFALAAWRLFVWIAAGLAVFVFACSIAAYLGYIPW